MARRIRKEYPKTEFYVLGDCEEKRYEDILQKAVSEGIIQYEGLQYDISPYLTTCHAIIHPTYHPEGMSNVLLEALASGRPIITTDRSGCREIVEDGINGYMVKQKDVEDLTKKVKRFLTLSNNEARETMGKKGREKVEKEFDRQIVIQAYLEEIKKIRRKT